MVCDSIKYSLQVLTSFAVRNAKAACRKTALTSSQGARRATSIHSVAPCLRLSKRSQCNRSKHGMAASSSSMNRIDTWSRTAAISTLHPESVHCGILTPTGGTSKSDETLGSRSMRITTCSPSSRQSRTHTQRPARQHFISWYLFLAFWDFAVSCTCTIPTDPLRHGHGGTG